VKKDKKKTQPVTLVSFKRLVPKQGGKQAFHESEIVNSVQRKNFFLRKHNIAYNEKRV